MPKQLNIRSDAAYDTATMLARRLDTTTTDVVVRALDDLSRKTFKAPTYEDLTPEQKADVDRLLEMAADVRRNLAPGVTSDHGDLYGENGLPR